MVTKHICYTIYEVKGLILAKNHMVTKPTNTQFPSKSKSYSSKKSYGNKTGVCLYTKGKKSYSSKKSYGNKTVALEGMQYKESYSCKKSYGNKTSNTCYHIFKNNKILNIL